MNIWYFSSFNTTILYYHLTRVAKVIIKCAIRLYPIINISIININNDKFKYYNKWTFVHHWFPFYSFIYNFIIFSPIRSPCANIYIAFNASTINEFRLPTPYRVIYITFASFIRLLIPRYYFTRAIQYAIPIRRADKKEKRKK